MYKNKLIRCLEGFSRKEMTRFYELSLSPYFNKHQDVRRLVAYLSNVFPDFTPQNCARTLLWKHLYGNQKHDQAKLALVFTYTFRLLETFLIQEEFKGKEAMAAVFLLQHLRKKGQYRHYEKVLQKTETLLQEMPYQDSVFFHLQFIAAAEADAYFAQLSRHEKDLRIQLKQDNLDYFYLSQKLRDACEMLVRSKILKIDYSTGILDAVVAAVEQQKERFESVPAIIVYYKIYQMLRLEDTQYYHQLLDLLEETEAVFSKEELHDIYNYLQHFSIEQFNKGHNDFLKAYFHLYQLQLQKELLTENGYLSEWHYKNIVTVGTRLQETDWVYDFIETYKQKLDPAKRENAYRFNLASYYYATQAYDKVLDLLLRVEYKDSRYIQGVKALLLRTYYDLDEEEALYSLIDSFRQYIKRDKNLSDTRKKGFSNLLKFTKRCFTLKMQQPFTDKTDFAQQVQKLDTSIRQTAPVFNQTWLLEKVGELA